MGFRASIRFAFLERIVGAVYASEHGIYHYHSENNKGQIFDGYGKFHVVERFENGDIAAFNFNNGGNRSLGIRIIALEIDGGPEAVVEEGVYEILDTQKIVIDKGKFIATWAREDGLWKLCREIWNSDMPVGK